ncbi:MAG: alanine--tRNA ligase [archaeon]|nr:alanine--tRNA ligase [archaeon]
MISEKEALRQKFSSEPDRYYRVQLFDKLGFVRKQCVNCQRFFWTLEERRTHCPDTTCQQYEFLGNPTPKKFDYVSAWKSIAEYFVKNGHHEIKRYPVVCRWRPDLYFTIASIVDFQRVESGKVVFELPANPLIVPQMCLRFVDIGNVGVTGRHFTSFCMIGQTALANAEGYWKDRCIELDFKLLTEVFRVPKEEIVFLEDVWLGPGAFGYSLEYYVRGLEMGNAVFTAFEGTPNDYVEYREKVVDMGAGLDRWVWLTNGTPTSYDIVFQKPLANLKDKIGYLETAEEKEFILKYYKLAGAIDVEYFKGKDTIPDEFLKQIGIRNTNEFRRKLLRLQAIYAVLDHTRTLLFAISDGALPSNVGGGYNLRVILRRAIDFARQIDASLDLGEIAYWHAEQLRPMYPELAEHVDEVRKILDVETEKYRATRERSAKIVESLVRRDVIVGTEQLIQLYDSEGITPETLIKAGLNAIVPPDFYLKVTQRHMTQRHDEALKRSFEVGGILPTNLLFYLNRDQFEFEAKVLRIIEEKYVILDNTAFYARSGGQEPDHGTINGLEVVDVVKFNNVVIHEVRDLKTSAIKESDIVNGIVDSRRRNLIMRHHTATHVVNGAARKVLGSWVWQHSAFKDEDMARLDITHFAHLTREQILEIENISNEVVRKNLPVVITWMPRTKAEQTYGFRIYQGGVVPSKEVRIVNIQGWDVEACGGTHCSSTGEIGLIKITKAERIQDGVERIEFVAGEAALRYVEKQESILLDSAASLETPIDKVAASISNIKQSEDLARRSLKQLAKRLADVMTKEIPDKSKKVGGGLLLYISSPTLGEEGLDSEYHLTVGERLTRQEPRIIYVAIFNEEARPRLMVFCGKSAQEHGLNAGILVKEISKSMGGSGGGDAHFGQGGILNIPSSLDNVEKIINSNVKVPSSPKSE